MTQDTAKKKKQRHAVITAPVFFYVNPQTDELMAGMRKPAVPVYEALLDRKKWADITANPAILSDALGVPVVIPTDFDTRIEQALLEDVKGYVPLLRKMGGLICGFEKCRVALSRNEVYCLLQAHDGSERERRRLTGGRENAALCLWSATELGRVFGRDSVHHAVVTKKAARGAWHAKVTAMRLFSQPEQDDTD